MAKTLVPGGEGGGWTGMGGGDQSKNFVGDWADFPNDLEDIIAMVACKHNGVVNGDTSEVVFSRDEGRLFDKLGQGEKVARQPGDE
jgi:hypothetical protein